MANEKTETEGARAANPEGDHGCSEQTAARADVTGPISACAREAHGKMRKNPRAVLWQQAMGTFAGPGRVGW